MKARFVAATLMFGSLWGILECTLGAFLHTLHLPAGAIMASIALALMVCSRKIFQVRGMQFSMALIASLFKLLNLGFIGGCVWCAMVAIISEGLLFELMLFLPVFSRLFSRQHVLTGAVFGYVCYSGGYFLTEIVTPMLSPAGFFLADLAALTPLILVRGLYAAVFSSVLVFFSLVFSGFDLSELKDNVYYPLTSIVTLLCWAFGLAL